MFLPNFESFMILRIIYRRREVEELSSLYYCQIPVEISQKLGVCHVRRPVSRDRPILVIEMEVGR